MIDFSRGAPKMVSADEAKREESAKLASERRPGPRFRGLEVESVPRAVASEAPAGILLREFRSLPLAVLTRRPSARKPINAVSYNASAEIRPKFHHSLRTAAVTTTYFPSCENGWLLSQDRAPRRGFKLKSNRIGNSEIMKNLITQFSPG